MEDINPNPTPAAPPPNELPPTKAEQPPTERFQNYFKLRGELQEKLEREFTEQLEGEIPQGRRPSRALPQLEVKGDPERQEYIREQASRSAFIVSQKVIKTLPRGTINREGLTESIANAQDEYADNTLWYDALINRKARKKIAGKIASGIDLASRQDEFCRIRDQETPAYINQAVYQLPSREAAVASVSQKLQQAGLNPDQSRKIAQNTVGAVARSSQSHGAELKDSHLVLIFQNQSTRILGQNNPIPKQSHLNLSIVGDLKKVTLGNAQPSLAKQLTGRGFKLFRRFSTTPGMKKFNLVYSTLHPIKTLKTVVVKTGKKILKTIGRGIMKLLFKIAPKLAMRLTQIGESLTGAGILVAIAQELLIMGIGKFLGVLKNVSTDILRAFKEGLSGNIIKGGLKLAFALIDAAGAAVGAVVGGIGGMAGGVALGAALGTIVPVIGNVVGAVLGGLLGLVTGAGFGADFGYKLRRRVMGFVVISYGIYYLIKSILPIVVTFVVGTVKAVLAQGFAIAADITGQATASAKNLVGITRLLPRYLWMRLQESFSGGGAVGKGVIGQSLQGAQALAAETASQGVRFVNKGTGAVQKAAVEAAAKGRDFLLRVTSDNLSPLASASPAITIGSVAFFSLITYNVFITAFHSPPTSAYSFSTPQSKYIGVVKVADPPGPFENSDLPLTINYTVTISALLGTLTNISYTNDYLIRQEPLIAAEPTFTLPDPPLTIAPGTPFVVTYSVVLNSDYTDAIVCDNFVVTAETLEGIQSSTGVACLVIGDPPDECPFIWPVLPEGSETSLNVNQGPFAPPTHAVINALDVDLSFTNNYHSVRATHSGLAIAGSGGNYGDYIDISSNCGGIMVTSRYAHLSARYVNNEAVTLGQQIGLTGKTGTSNHHLHYEFRPPTALPPMAPPFVPKVIPYACYDWGSNPCNVTIP